MNFIKQHPVFLVFCVLVTTVIGFTVNTYSEKQNQNNRGRFGGGAPLVVTAKVANQDIVDEVESIGTANANESVSLVSKVTDTVSKVNFEDGMLVEAGDILVELTNLEETAQLAEAQATVVESTKQFKRIRNLITQKLASETQLDIENARMQTAEAKLEAIVARLDDRLIRAPFSGVLGFREISPGTLLSPNTLVTTLDDISIIKLDFSVPENYLSALEKGQEVLASSSAYPGRTFNGKVHTISSRIDPVTRSITIRAHLGNDENLLRPGMLLTVKLVQKRSRVLAVPEESVIPIQNTQYVYVVEDGTAQRVEIDVGRRRPGFVEVLSGLVEGQEVITQGIIKVRPGSRVTLMSDQATQARSGPGIESTGKKTGRKGKKSGRPGKSG